MSVNLNRRLVLEEPIRVADGAGGYTENWFAKGTLWAAVKGSGRRQVCRRSRTELLCVQRRMGQRHDRARINVFGKGTGFIRSKRFRNMMRTSGI